MGQDPERWPIRDPRTDLERADALIAHARAVASQLRSWNANLVPSVERAVRELADGLGDLADATAALTRHVRAVDGQDR